MTCIGCINVIWQLTTAAHTLCVSINALPLLSHTLPHPMLHLMPCITAGTAAKTQLEALSPYLSCKVMSENVPREVPTGGQTNGLNLLATRAI